MPTLLVDCPYTHRKFSSGIETNAQSLSRSWKARLEITCPHCHKTHSILVREAYVDGALKDALALSSSEIRVDAR